MSYQVLARKYRPKGFDTLVGQEHVVRALSHALDSGRLHHAYLFTGTRGVGKTTLSRILAKAFNCIGADGNGGVTSTPCGVCEACVAIDGGRFVDYIEIDAASNRGVDEMAQLLEQAVYAPSNARFKVYMIDEVHMLTNHAFNAMLKTLEEPPEHVKFILATTDPQKIPVTVLSRCLQFNLKQMPPAQIIAHLADILGQETIPFETPALRLLAHGAHGSMRDALSLTDQAIAYAAGNVTLDAVQTMLGALDQSFLVQVLDALAVRDGAALIAIADDMASRSLSYNAALQDIGSLLHRIALAQTVPAAIADDLPERADILRLAGAFDAEEIQLFYQIAVHGRNELGLAPDDYAGFTMTLLRMLAFRPGMGAADGGGPARSGSLQSSGSGNGQSAAPTVARTATQTRSALDNPLVPAPAPSKPPPTEITAAAAPSARAPGAISPARAALNAARSGMKVAAPGAAGSAATRPPVAPPVAPATPVSAFGPSAAPAFASMPAPLPGSVFAPAPAPIRSVTPADDGPIELAPAPPWDEEFSSAGSSASLPPVIDEAQRTSPARSMPMPMPMSKATPMPTSMPPRAPAPSRTPASGMALAPVTAAPPAPAQAPVLVPVPALGWDGDWPPLAVALPLRGVAQQLALQSELMTCEMQGDTAQFHLLVGVETLRAAGSVDKLAAALSERFARTIRIETELGPVRHTANILLLAERAECQRQAELTMHGDPFVQALMREFGATIVPGSIKPISLN
ncbi:MAG: DNA polymerase III subunit gamma/tau [Herminiimonas sp.]|nr:DNA polymerase III subunit gamma/tau [Herminiimonas sp.]